MVAAYIPTRPAALVSLPDPRTGKQERFSFHRVVGEPDILLVSNDRRVVMGV